MNSTVRVAIFADIHSNLAALEACIADSTTLGAQEYIVLGDIVSDWHHPNECVDRIRALTPFVIKGNREQYFQDASVYMDLWEIYDQFASLLWTYQTLTPENLQYLTELPSVLKLCGRDAKIRAVHGSPFRMNELIRQEDGEGRMIQALESIEEDILLFGHSHEQWKYEFEGKLALNPGSVGCHCNQEGCAEYALLEISDQDVRVTFRQVPYDVDGNFREVMMTDLYQKAYPWVSLLYSAMKTGRDALRHFLEDIDTARKQDPFSMGGPIPNDIYHTIFDEMYAPGITEMITGLQ